MTKTKAISEALERSSQAFHALEQLGELPDPTSHFPSQKLLERQDFTDVRNGLKLAIRTLAAESARSRGVLVPCVDCQFCIEPKPGAGDSRHASRQCQRSPVLVELDRRQTGCGDGERK